MVSVQEEVNTLAEALAEAGPGRRLLALAGPPGCGKTTLASALCHRLTLQRRRAVVVPMDGFHLDNEVLAERGLLARRGAPETFDAQGFLRMARALKAGEEVVAPRFDRARDIAIAGAVVVPQDAEVVILEGNYLLFDEDPWRDLAPLWDISVWLDVPLPDLRARLIQRWLSLNHSRATATRRAEGNDLPNAQRVLDARLPATYLFEARPGGAASLTA